MADTYNIDSHKLIYHPKRVASWLQGHTEWETARTIYPLYVEIAPIGACNHRCVFCSVDYLDYNPVSQDYLRLRDIISEMASLGVKSIMFAGEGEPSLWKKLPDLLQHCTDVGIDTSMTTNMVPFNDETTEPFVANCAWIKTSINAGTPESYAAIHRTHPSDFQKVLHNFRHTVSVRNQHAYPCTIGAQMLLLPENASEAYTLGLKLKETGVDYLVIKPYTQSLYGNSHTYEHLDYTPYLSMHEQLQELEDQTFSIVFRGNTMRKYNEPNRMYPTCNATPFFWAYIMANGSLYGCSAFLGNEKFNYGNINDSSFKELWESEKRRNNLTYIQQHHDISKCRKNCRMDEINRYLWTLTHPDRHVNFI